MHSSQWDSLIWEAINWMQLHQRLPLLYVLTYSETKHLLYVMCPCQVLDSSEAFVDVPCNGPLKFMLLVAQLLLKLTSLPDTQ